ncbi:MAG: potassium transporter Kef [Verrucomicrobia bacterium 13_1_40CM_4_54_4]|nr:MAG: potassium transporter Kef [Verrucomicrobia bacterium 13_1_40CM_4_54_4]PYJ51543.1 MAG: potassium transporter Kef [Verrucomicrobiota bacterium]
MEESVTQNVWFIAAIWMALALSASLISIWAGISVALVEILVGVIAGNFLGIHATTDWINFLALLGSGVLTFLAGAEIDPRSLKANLRASGLIGILSFGVPFAIVWLFAQFILGWPLHQAQIAGVALSTTSVAVVYAVMIEGGYSETAMGKTILAACFITDFGTVLALGVLFATFDMWLVVFVVVMCVVLWFMPRWTQSIIERLGATRVSEPEVKFIFFILFFLGGLATTAKSEAVLPAYLAGLVVAGVFLRDKTLVNRMRSIAFAIFTPFYFIKAGLYVSLPALWAGLGIIGALLLLKMITKLVGVFPLARMHYMGKREASYTTLLMATGLTFGTISALFGLQNKIIDQRQYTILVSVVILSAFVPTLIAQKFFQPTVEAMHAWGRLYRKRMRVLSVEDVGDNGDMKNE